MFFDNLNILITDDNREDMESIYGPIPLELEEVNYETSK